MLSYAARSDLFAIGLLATAASSATAQGLFARYGEVVIGNGDQVPDLPTGITIFSTNFLGLDAPLLDQNGTMVFRARFQDTGGGSTVTPENNRGYLMGRTRDDLRLVVRADDPAPGIPGATLRSSSTTDGSNGLNSTPRISPYGEILLWSSNVYNAANPPSTHTGRDTALFWGTPGNYTLLAREGDPVPVTGGGTWGDLLSNFGTGTAHINSSGRVLMASPVATQAGTQLLWTGTPGNLEKVIREGDTLPSGLIVDSVFGDYLTLVAMINESGQVLHDMGFAHTSSPAVTSANDRALALWTPGTSPTRIIAREDDPIPALPGVSFGGGLSGWQPFVCGFNRDGTTLLSTNLLGAVTYGVDDQALLFGGSSGWAVVCRLDDAAPGIPGARILQLGEKDWGASVNAAGQVVFVAGLTGTPGGTTDDTAIFYGTVGNLVAIAREGDPVVAAGLGGGPWTYDQILTSNFTVAQQRQPHLNDRGQVWWEAPITDGTTHKMVGLAYDPALGWRCIFDGSESIALALGTGSPNSVQNHGRAVSSDGSRTWFNNQGDWAGKLNFLPPMHNAVVRGHVGTMICEPSSVPVTGGVPQNFHIDLGVAQANRFYLVLATGFGTRPGFVSPFGGQLVPLNPDPLLTTISLNNPNSSVWVNTLGTLDANGVGIGPASFVLPADLPGFLGVTIHHVAIAFDLTGGFTTHYASEPSAVRFH